MVIDWYKQIRDCLAEGKLLPIFHGKETGYCYQKLMVVRELLKLGHTKEQIADWLENADETGLFVEDYISLSKLITAPRRVEYRCWVSSTELAYIEALRATSECKSYLLALVCFAKMMNLRHDSPILPSRYHSYVYYVAMGTDDYRCGKQRRGVIDRFIHRMVKEGVITFSPRVSYRIESRHWVSCYGVRLQAGWIEWDAKEGYLVEDLEKDVQECIREHPFTDTHKKGGHKI